MSDTAHSAERARNHTPEVNSCEDLKRKIRAVSKLNAELLEGLESRTAEEVVLRYNYKITLNFAGGADGCSATAVPPIDIERKTKKVTVQKRIDAWTYAGAPLEQPRVCVPLGHFVFDRSLHRYADLPRLNGTLRDLFEQFVPIAGDNDAVRDILRSHLNNFEKIQVAIGQVDALTMSVDNDLEASDVFHSSLEAVVAVVNGLPKGSSFSLTGRNDVANVTNEERPPRKVSRKKKKFRT